ncbi:tRNA/rRNA methyltransferase [Acerihabitans arboris]|uniref:tRNA/rRNA methyltransferase n=1 Tax=Acerihabitans arboris TaxID=2691583 RepID=A0A845SLT2_9GAMM|nr:tRNA/rRNA methyltransferase [Acerihabitans arboris]NDL63946.1 tRNA/rRNA methyltransferase [Acerihabitans arboris]
MSDSLKGKNGKVRVMYVRKEEEEQPRRPSRPPQQGRDGNAGRGDTRRGDAPRGDARRGDAPRGDTRRGDAPRGDARRGDAPRGDTRRGDAPRGDTRRGDAPWGDAPRADARRGDSAGGEGRSRRDKPSAAPDSPWKTLYQNDDTPAVADHGGISGKSLIDPDQLRRQRAEETRVYGENACQALFKSRPDSIVRAWFVQSVTPRFRDALRWMAANRKAYHVVEEEELALASGTDHHGGVCFLIKKRIGLDAVAYLGQTLEKDCVLALEDVSNPHNLGAMLRSCAHFGVKGVMTSDSAALESGAAVRTAEGGAEHISSINTDDLFSDLARFRQAGYTIVTTSSHKGTSLARVDMPAKMVLVIGQERAGLSDAIVDQADLAISIGGTGRVESLNVSVATGILLAEWWRQNH